MCRVSTNTLSIVWVLLSKWTPLEKQSCQSQQALLMEATTLINSIPRCKRLLDTGQPISKACNEPGRLDAGCILGPTPAEESNDAFSKACAGVGAHVSTKNL